MKMNAVLIVCGLAAGSAAAGVIDFETLPGGGLPMDDMALDRNAVYMSGGVGVSFGFDTTGDGYADEDAVFEQRGDGPGSNEGFVSTLGNSGFDTEAPGFENMLGEFFLRTADAISDNPGTFVITYDTAVSALSGEIWDLDGRGDGTFEQWDVTGFDAAGNQVASLLSPVGINNNDSANTLDSKPWTFSLASDLGISRVTVEYVGNADGVGLAFDNYNATAIPAPGALAGLGVVGLAAARRRRV